MKTSLKALFLLALMSPTPLLAAGGWNGGGGYHGSATVVVGAPRAGYYRGGYGGYYGPRWGGYGYAGGVGVYLGAPLVWGWPWVPPAYYPPIYPPVVTVAPPLTYVERDEVISAPLGGPLEPGYWYFCREKGGYYPAVKTCPGQWQKVAPVSK